MKDMIMLAFSVVALSCICGLAFIGIIAVQAPSDPRELNARATIAAATQAAVGGAAATELADLERQAATAAAAVATEEGE